MIKSVTQSALVVSAIGALLTLLEVAPLQAASKVWVSNSGVDSGTCGAVTSPCATFQQAVSNVASGGEIGVLTPGDYAPVTINNAVNITNDGTGEASVLANQQQLLASLSMRGLVT